MLTDRTDPSAIVYSLGSTWQEINDAIEEGLLPVAISSDSPTEASIKLVCPIFGTIASEGMYMVYIMSLSSDQQPPFSVIANVLFCTSADGYPDSSGGSSS